MHMTKKQALAILAMAPSDKWVADWLELDAEVKRLRVWVKEAHREGCEEGLNMGDHLDSWDDSEARRQIQTPEVNDG